MMIFQHKLRKILIKRIKDQMIWIKKQRMKKQKELNNKMINLKNYKNN